MPSLPGHVTSKFSLEELNDDGEYSTVQYSTKTLFQLQYSIQYSTVLLSMSIAFNTYYIGCTA